MKAKKTSCEHETFKWELDEPISIVCSFWNLVCVDCEREFGFGVKFHEFWAKKVFYDDLKKVSKWKKKIESYDKK